MNLPPFLKAFEEQARKLVDSQHIKYIEYSGPTYQVQIRDSDLKEDVWAFLQLDLKGELKDSFCSCHDSEDKTYCVHLAAALISIYKNHSLPLHVRFQQSLWNGLCFIYASRFNDDSKVFKTEGRKIYLRSPGGKIIFQLEAKNQKTSKFFKELFFQKTQETEETSLKFSNLPLEELILWREGRPSPQLSYELSFWNDLAKELMRLEDLSVPYEISYDYSEKQLPNFINIHFPEFQIGFYVSEANLPAIIPTLKRVHSPLKVHDVEEERIEKIFFDKIKGCFLLQIKNAFHKSILDNKLPKIGIKIGRWLYVKEEGFYAQDLEGLLSKEEICANDIAQLLNQSLPFLKEKLEGSKIYEQTIPVSYALDFDADWNLHVVGYVFNPGDLSSGYSHLFQDWVYLDDDGFYHLSDLLFDKVETVISPDKMADFVRQYRAWLDTKEGFQTHLVSIESQLAYQVNENNQLSFIRKLDVKDQSLRSKDFGPWIYVAGQGFYSKVNTAVGLPIQFGVPLRADQIPIFIRMNREELKLVTGFFSEKCPVVKSGINILLDEKNQFIHISPEYVLLPEYQTKDVRFFDDFVFVKNEGFHELPIDTRLPEKFHHPMIIEAENFPYFLGYELENIKSYAAVIDDKLRKPDQLQLVAHHIKRHESGKGWYEMKLSYQTSAGLIPIAQIVKALKQKKRFYFSEAGYLDLKDKRFDWLKLLPKNRLDKKNNLLIISTVELIRLNAFEDMEILEHSKFYQESKDLLTELTEFKIPAEPDIQGLQSQLRSYQQGGVRWLWFLYQHMLSGLLCDDMGLGKTHQTMALFAAILNDRAKQDSLKIRFLIICPTSVIYHWQEKLQMFLPQLNVLTYHGGQRSIDGLNSPYDILLTSYGIWRIEHEFLSQIPFEVAVFDEIQIAKNHHSRIHASLLTIDAQMRLGLTGTPIENHLRELKALFDIVLPYYMPGDADFREFFVKPIEREQDRNRKSLLTRFVKPFMLRRKKEDVLLDLPEKIEEISHCDLSLDQVVYYNEVLVQGRARILPQLEDGGQPIPYVHIFALLSSLKQICDHPAVYLKEPANYREYTSGKWNLFVELLNEARESSQKVVVFSQYLMMMDIIEDYLNEIGVGYASIRGSTINRAEQLQRFNQDPKCEVFVASLQATGLGIDLTAASIVIHYDRWWNAARENQATDRVYRIGQKRGVQVFKLVTKNTFEEKIDALIAKKGLLMEEIVSVDDQNLIKQFNRDDIIQLLQTVHLPPSA